MNEKTINLTKNEYGLIEEEQCEQIVKDVTGGTVSENMGEIPDWIITDEVDKVRPVGTTIFTTEFDNELIRLPNGGFHIYRRASKKTDDGAILGASTTFVDQNHAFIWAMHHGLISSIDEFTRSIDKGMCHEGAKILNKNHGPMAHKMDTQAKVFQARVGELLDLKVFRKCVLLINGEVQVVEITDAMATNIQQLCQLQGEDFRSPYDGAIGSSKLMSLREELKEAHIGELESKEGTCHFVTKCSTSAWDFPSKIPYEQPAIWCLPITPTGKNDLKKVAMSAVTLCVSAEALLTAIEWPVWVLDRASIRSTQTDKQQSAVSPNSKDIFSMQDIWNEKQ